MKGWVSVVLAWLIIGQTEAIFSQKIIVIFEVLRKHLVPGIHFGPQCDFFLFFVLPSRKTPHPCQRNWHPADLFVVTIMVIIPILLAGIFLRWLLTFCIIFRRAAKIEDLLSLLMWRIQPVIVIPIIISFRLYSLVFATNYQDQLYVSRKSKQGWAWCSSITNLLKLKKNSS